MEEIGLRLRSAREQLGLTLEEVEKATRIRSHHLDALERGDHTALPSSVQARGFLRNYSDFLGLDTDAILLNYAEDLQRGQRGRRRAQAQFDEPVTGPSVRILSARPRWLSIDLLVAAVITFGVLVFIIWGGNRLMASLRDRTEAASEGSGLLLPTPSLTVEPSQTLIVLEGEAPPAEALVDGTATGTATVPAILSEQPINMRLLADRRVWVAVIADGEDVFRGRLAPGSFVEAQASVNIEVATGNAGAVRVFYNGEDQGVMGSLQQILVLIWTLDGAVTPTPTDTPLPTETLPATATETATP